MKILYLHRTQARGVEGVHVAEIVKAFRGLGHEVAIVSPVGDRLGDEQPKAAPGRSDGLYRWISRHVPELVFELVELAYNVQALWQARRRRGSVGLLFERYAIFAIAGALLSRRWGRPLVVEVNYTSSSPLVRKRSAILKPLARALDRFVFERAAGLTVVSSELRRHLIQVYGVAPQKIILVPNAADPEVFDPARIAASRFSAGKVIGFVGGFYPWHGLDVLVEAFRLVSARVSGARLLLIGDGPMMPAIRAQVAALGLEDRVTLTGWVDHAELPAHIARFHVGVMPDSNDYGSPMKIFEYMAMNKPVVVPDYPPLRDVVTDGAEGRIFRPRDAHSLADCLTMLLTDDAAHGRMSENARSKIVSTHNWRRNAEEILSLVGPRTA